MPPKFFSRKLKTWRQRIGRAGEQDAVRLLTGLGYVILARDYRNRRGELDIVARDGGTIVFVEVKTRFYRPGQKEMPEPWRQLRDSQKIHIYRGAIAYMESIQDIAKNMRFRFDLIEVVRTRFTPVAIRHHTGFMGRPKFQGKNTPARVLRRRKNKSEDLFEE